MTLTAFYDEKNEAQLRHSYCAFIDILGFTDEIKAAANSGREDDLFRRFMRDIEPQVRQVIVPSEKDNLDGWPRMWDAKVFTDNAILGYALWSGHGEKEFGHALFQLMEFQLGVALKGFFVRGGWAVGNLFMNQNTVFGSALLEAYALESKVAVYPRVILSPTMKDYVLHHMSFYAEDPPQCDHLLIDGAGVMMTHYLTETIPDGSVQWEWLEQHARTVSQRLGEFSGNARVFEKYQWLAAYHNFFCDQVHDAEGYSEEVRVPGDFPDFGLRRLRRDDSPYPPSPKKPW